MALELKYRYIAYDGSVIVYRDLDGHQIGFGSTGTNNLIRVNTQQDRTYLIDNLSGKFYKLINNTKKTDSGKAVVYNDYTKDEEYTLTEIPNRAAVLNIRFGDASGSTNYNVTRAFLTASGLQAVKETRSDKNYIYVAEICHPNVAFGGVGSGSTTWSTLASNFNLFLNLSKNPGPSGINGNVSSSGSPQKVHDWHLAIAVEPLDIVNAPYITLSCIIEYI